MKKKLAFVLSLMLFLTGMVSAMYGGYGSISLGNLLYSIDESTLVLGVIFLMSFALVFFSTLGFFRENKAVTSAVSFGVSLLIIWGINRSGFGYMNIFNDVFFFLPQGFLETFWPLIILGIGIVSVVKLGFMKGIGALLFGVGLVLVFMIFTGIIYDSALSANMGIFLAIAGAVVFFLGKKKREEYVLKKR